MQIGFFVQVTSPASQVHLEIAKYMLASARKHMPDVKVVQFTDNQTRELEGVDSCVRIGGDMPMAVRRLTHHASCLGDWLFVDTDIIFQKDCRDVFDEPFDVALTDRVGTYMEGSQYAIEQPYNMGVTFSRNPEFWKEAVKRLKNYPAKFQEWEGDQMIVCGMAENPSTPFDIIIIPGKIYNFTPKLQDEDYSHAAIIHMKGSRKSWLK